jgi:hypothetical protein
MRTFAALLALATLSCGSVEPVSLTWGDVSERLAISWCNGIDRCNLGVPEGCIEQSIENICGEPDTCEVELPDEARSELQACVNEIDAIEGNYCIMFLWGIVPDACGPIIERNPEE